MSPKLAPSPNLAAVSSLSKNVTTILQVMMTWRHQLGKFPEKGTGLCAWDCGLLTKKHLFSHTSINLHHKTRNTVFYRSPLIVNLLWFSFYKIKQDPIQTKKINYCAGRMIKSQCEKEKKKKKKKMSNRKSDFVLSQLS